MRHIYKGDTDISSLVEVATKDSSVVFRFFKETGVFLSDEEVKKLERWLTDYAEMLYFNGKSNRLNNKSDISEAKEVITFLGEFRSFEKPKQENQKMKKKVTREEVLTSIIKLINEHREDVVEEDASLGHLHIGVQTLMWMYDWLCEEYSKVNMERPLEEELRTLVQGDTLGKLADIAMAHIKGDGEYEVEEEPDSSDEKVWNVWIQKIEKANSSEGVNALRGPEKMTKAEFMKQCGEFWDNRGSHCDDFEIMSIRLTEVTS